MEQLISLFYLFFLFGAALMALFVTYHIARYSLSKQSAFWGNILFLSVFLFFFVTNVLLFSRIDWASTPINLSESRSTSIW